MDRGLMDGAESLATAVVATVEKLQLQKTFKPAAPSINAQPETQQARLGVSRGGPMLATRPSIREL
jgi:hypothetical protein